MTGDDLIAAMACAPGMGARSIIRVSGRGVSDILGALSLREQMPTFSKVESGLAPGISNDNSVRDFITPSLTLRVSSPVLKEPFAITTTVAHRFGGMCQTTLDGRSVAIPVNAYYWPHSRSFTGQPSVELHTIGSPLIGEALLNQVFQCGARPARKGEFTLRAFLTGHVDLVQAEAVLGAIDAADHEELDNALRQLAGGVSGRIREARSELLNLLADLEAGLDFVDEDIVFVSPSQVLARLNAARDVVADLLLQSQNRMHAAINQRVVLAGDPNSGKSTLFNRLVGNDTAIVSPIAGTTRDYLKSRVAWSGHEFELVDTAGWENQDCGIEGEAQDLRTEQVHDSDLLVWCVACDATAVEQTSSLGRFREHVAKRPNALLAITKTDLAANDRETVADIRSSALVDCSDKVPQVVLSARTGEGLEQLLNLILNELAKQRRGSRDFIGSTAARASSSLLRADEALRQASSACQASLGDEVVAVEIREALDALGEIVGAVVTDDLLDRIFSRFCIGK